MDMPEGIPASPEASPGVKFFNPAAAAPPCAAELIHSLAAARL